MRSKFLKLGLGLAASAAVLMAAVTQAQVPPDRYVQDPFRKPIKDPFGKCVLSIGGQNLPECGAPLAVKEPPKAPTVQTVTLGADAYFDFDKATLKPAGRERLDALATEIRQLGGTVSSVAVVGNTDAIGTEAYNQALSERRAQAVVDYLVRQGVNPGVISAQGAGEGNPVASNETAEGRAQNRRVDVTVESRSGR